MGGRDCVMSNWGGWGQIIEEAPVLLPRRLFKKARDVMGLFDGEEDVDCDGGLDFAGADGGIEGG